MLETKALLDNAAGILLKNAETYAGCFPAECCKDGFYPKSENNNWTTGFFTGCMWLAYEHTGDERFKAAAEAQAEDFARRLRERVAVDHHDMGFLYSLSCVAAYKLTGTDKSDRQQAFP